MHVEALRAKALVNVIANVTYVFILNISRRKRKSVYFLVFKSHVIFPSKNVDRCSLKENGFEFTSRSPSTHIYIILHHAEVLLSSLDSGTRHFKLGHMNEKEPRACCLPDIHNEEVIKVASMKNNWFQLFGSKLK